MNFRLVILHLLFLVTVLVLKGCTGEGNLQLQLVRYYSSGGCGGIITTDVCDFVFRVEATTEILSNGTWVPHVAVLFDTDVFQNQNDVNFTMSLDAFGSGLSNPIDIAFGRPVLNMTFSSVDIDTASWPYGASNTSIADLSFSLNVSAAGTVFREVTYKTGFLQLLYKVYCNSNYTGSGCDKCTADQYGPDCSVKCKAEESLTSNYTCNPTTGAKVCQGGRALPDCKACSPDLYGPLCNVSCSETVQSGCDARGNMVCKGKRGGASCLSCLPSYYSTNCSVQCAAGAGWSCDAGSGARVCKSGWSGKDCLTCATGLYGTQCDVVCSPVPGRYNCSSTGTKLCITPWGGANCDQCMPGYYGTNCSTHCVDQIYQPIQYKCDPNGAKVCTSGWNGDDCSNCAPKYTGVRCDQCITPWGGANCDQCLPGYYGTNCSVFCVDQPQYKCHSNGSKVCTSGWSGTNCSSCAANYYRANCGTLCVPQPGIYSCDNNGTVQCEGNRAGAVCDQCQQGWYGVDCDVNCVEEMRYSCDSTGTRVCRWHWGGVNCTECPDNRAGAECDACAEHYYGTNCSTYCATPLLGHYVCTEQGDKLCLKGWMMPHLNCTLQDKWEDILDPSPLTNVKSLARSAIMIGVSALSVFCLIVVIFWAVNRKHQKSRVAEKQSHIEENTSREADSEEESVETGNSFYYSNPAYVDDVNNDSLEEYKNPAYDDLEDF